MRVLVIQTMNMLKLSGVSSTASPFMTLGTDILLLADMFEYFRGTSNGTYGPVPAHKITLPGSSWQLML